MFKKLCITAICLNTVMFMVNIVVGNNDWALLNITSAILCWIPFITLNNKED